MEAMKNAAMYNINSAGVEQSKAAYAQVMASIPEIEQSIREVGKFSINSSWRSSPPYPTRYHRKANSTIRIFSRHTYPIIIQPSGCKSG